MAKTSLTLFFRGLVTVSFFGLSIFGLSIFGLSSSFASLIITKRDTKERKPKRMTLVTLNQ